MVDIHSHILPGLDDGPRTLDESVAMLRLAQAAGTTDIVATPHANPEYQFDPDRISEEIERLAQAAGPAPRIHRGCDFHLAYDNVQDAIAHPSKYTINHGCYLLVEFSDLLILQNIGEVFDRLLEAGMVPVITHPERNWLLQQRGEQLRSWVERGCLLQVTAASLLGRFGRRAKRFSDLLLQAGLVHFIASDAHDPEDRTPDMRGAYAYVSRKFGGQWAEYLFVENPRRTLSGDPIELEAMPEPVKPRKWYRLWR